MSVEILIPILSVAGSLLAVVITFASVRSQRRSLKIAETQARAQSTNSQLRWAIELALSSDSAMARVGVEQLTALLKSGILDKVQEEFVVSALETVLRGAVQDLERQQGNTTVVAVPEDESEQDPR